MKGKFSLIPEYKNDDNYVDGAAYALTQQDGTVVQAIALRVFFSETNILLM